MKEVIVRLEDVTFFYEEPSSSTPPAVHNISLSIEDGEYVAVLGHNGSGKSTLAKLINLNLDPTYGKIKLFGTDITDDSFTYEDMFSMRQKVGMVFKIQITNWLRLLLKKMLLLDLKI